MSKLFIEDTTLSAIGNAIREKTGSSELISPVDMPAAIGSISGGGSGLTEWTITQQASQAVYCAPTSYNGLNEYIDGKSFTINIDGTSPGLAFLFPNSDNLVDLSKVVINFKSGNAYGGATMFSGCHNLEYLPTLNVADSIVKELNNFFNVFQKCYRLRYITDNLWTPLMSLLKTSGSANFNLRNMFVNCYSLRELPDMSAFNNITSSSTNNNFHLYNNFVCECYTLNAVENLPVINYTNNITSNMFQYTFDSCYRLKDITFTTDNGTPIARTWSNQTIDLSSYVGYSSSSTSNILNYNSGITADKRVIDDTTYQALKNDPDWFTTDIAYSRYNHDSAVRTINSLPDCSTGSGNTITFKGASGSATDGGAINTLTEEEIAVATAKGWTVKIV